MVFGNLNQRPLGMSVGDAIGLNGARQEWALCYGFRSEPGPQRSVSPIVIFRLVVLSQRERRGPCDTCDSQHLPAPVLLSEKIPPARRASGRRLAFNVPSTH